MKFTLHTYEIQDLMIALIEYKVEHHEDTNKTIKNHEMNRLQELLVDLNSLCREENDYTIRLNVE